MWWLIGTLIGTAWNLHDEKRNPELRAKREREAQQGCLNSLIFLGILIVAILLVVIIGGNELGGGYSSSSQKNSPSSQSLAGAPPVPQPTATVPTTLPESSDTTAKEIPPVQAPTTAVLVAPADVSSFPNSETLTESSYLGTTDTNFGKSWVIVNGKKIDGITVANPAPKGQVAILYAGGGKNIPVSSLPRGFLDLWHLTPEKLKAANNQ